MASVKYTFSGHESFPCKSLWLKKGYEFVKANKDFNSPTAVLDLGVGKNMVTSIRYWLRSFGITKEGQLTDLANYIFDDEVGVDPYIEDLGTLWLLHFMLFYTNEATLYHWVFSKFIKERKEFERSHVLNFVKRSLIEREKVSLYNENTVKKDIGVLLQNYVLPKSDKSYEDFSSILIDLDLIHQNNDGKIYFFNFDGKRKVTPAIFLFAIVTTKGKEQSVAYDTLQDLGLVFCMNDAELIEMLKLLSVEYRNLLTYSDVAGIRQLLFTEEISPMAILQSYYEQN